MNAHKTSYYIFVLEQIKYGNVYCHPKTNGTSLTAKNNTGNNFFMILMGVNVLSMKFYQIYGTKYYTAAGNIIKCQNGYNFSYLTPCMAKVV